MANQNDLRFLIKIATLYYTEGMKQTEIARVLNLSQSQVSRALNRCVKDGLVKISVIQPSNIFISLERELQSRYGFTQAIVVDVPEDPSQTQIQQAIGSSAAHYMQTSLQKNELVGISSWSETIRAMVDGMHPLSITAKGVIQLLGGIGPDGNLQATMLTHSLANMLNCEFFLLPAVTIERSVEDKARLLNSIEVASVVEKFNIVDLAIIGIGSMEPSNLLRNSGNYYQKKMTDELIKRGAVGDICLHYYDENGVAVLSDEEDPVISMTLEQLKACPRVVALAGGIQKVSAIRAALKGGLIDVLITDRITATELAK